MNTLSGVPSLDSVSSLGLAQFQLRVMYETDRFDIILPHCTTELFFLFPCDRMFVCLVWNVYVMCFSLDVRW